MSFELTQELRFSFIRVLDDIGDRLVAMQPDVRAEDPKPGDEVLTSADLEMDRYGIAQFKNVLPSEWAIYSEESGVVREFTGDGPVVEVTFDFLCGSKAYLEGQNYGIAVTASILVDGEVMASFVRDVFSRTFYFAYVGSNPVGKVFKRWPNGALLPVTTEAPASLKDMRVVMRCHPAEHGPLFEALVHPDVRAFVGIRVLPDVSLPLTLLELVNGNAGAHILVGSPERPKKFKKHDTAPFLLLLELAGFVWLRPGFAGRCLERFEPQVSVKLGEPMYLDHPAIVVHEDSVRELLAAWARLFAEPDCP